MRTLRLRQLQWLSIVENDIYPIGFTVFMCRIRRATRAHCQGGGNQQNVWRYSMDVGFGGPAWVPEQRIALNAFLSSGLLALITFFPLANDQIVNSHLVKSDDRANNAAITFAREIAAGEENGDSLTPEPSSLALLAAGLGIIAAVRKRGRWFR